MSAWRWPAAFLAVVLLGSAHAATDPILPRDSLWQVIQMCKQFDAAASSPFPCLDVQAESNQTPGFGIVPTPGMPAVLLVPSRELPGIESPELLAPGHPNWWKFAWDARYFLFERVRGRLTRNDIALAINSQSGRSQDQLHIHIGCINPTVIDQIRTFEAAITTDFSLFPVALSSQTFLAMRLVEEDLESNPFRLLGDIDPALRGPMADWGMAVLAWTFADGKDGFLVFATRTNEEINQSGSGAILVDPTCAKLSS